MQPKINRGKTIQEDMDLLKKRREERKMKEGRKGNQGHDIIGKAMDKDYERMIRQAKADIYSYEPENHTSIDNSKIFVVIRKRPLSRKEIANGEIDCISSLNPRVTVHECKIKIDGITKYLEDHDFYFDNTFGENETTEEIYDYTVGPMIDLVLKKGIVTCFAYGQTGSGKTYTMKGIQNLAIDSLFEEIKNIKKNFEFYISFFEIYGGRLYDLLNNKSKLQVLDDSSGKTHVYGLQEIMAETPDDMRIIIDKANSIRTTHNTVTNETSSRSHAICNIVIKEKGSSGEYGKLSLVDLAGSERAQETQSNNRLRRAEGAEINKSLLALKECIRALEARKSSGNTEIHIPFRASKLTHVLRDSFVSKSDKSRIIMISCINPSYMSSNHTINTLRYSDRLKEQTAFVQKQANRNKGTTSYNSQPPLSQVGNKVNNNNINHNHGTKAQNPSKIERDREKELEEINMNVFNAKDDILNDINFDDRINLDDDLLDFKKNIRDEEEEFNDNKKNNIEKNNHDIEEEENIQKNNQKMDNTPIKGINKQDKGINDELEDLIYLKKTVSKEGKFISDDFIRYHKLTDKIVEDEDDIVTTHMDVIKQDAKLLTEEGELISKIKGIGNPDEKLNIDDYLKRLDKILDKKIMLYTDLQNKIDVYKDHLKEEDQMRKEHPQFFVDPADL